mmetsp:Transcript_11970/g.21755  ORF Transcript_11970/g.21755 Transcript_11970/m.21755 type:complete len:97 (+) Transcript_11970:305-595(+)
MGHLLPLNTVSRFLTIVCRRHRPATKAHWTSPYATFCARIRGTAKRTGYMSRTCIAKGIAYQVVRQIEAANALVAMLGPCIASLQQGAPPKIRNDA